MCASRAPLAERAAVNRQVLGSIPSGGVIFFGFFFSVAQSARTHASIAVAARVHTGGSSAVEQRTVKCV